MEDQKLTEEEQNEIQLIRILSENPGWKNYMVPKLQDLFKSKYTQLRKCRRDSTFYQVQGYLNALEYVLSLCETRIKELLP